MSWIVGIVVIVVESIKCCGGAWWAVVDHGGSRWLIAHPLVECRE